MFQWIIERQGYEQMVEAKRQIGLEQEFFLVDQTGVLSQQADEFLQGCQQRAEQAGSHPRFFVPEFVKSMVEINTPPAYSAAELAKFYVQHLKVALRVARDMGLRLYPLSSYPLHIMPVMRDNPVIISRHAPWAMTMPCTPASVRAPIYIWK